MDDNGRYSNSTLHLHYNTTSKQLTRLQCRPNGTLLADIINPEKATGREIVINHTSVDLSDNITPEYVEHQYLRPLKNRQSGLLQRVGLGQNEATEQRVITIVHHFWVDDAQALLLIVAEYWQITVSHKKADTSKLRGLLIVNFAGNIIFERLLPPAHNDAATNLSPLFAAFTQTGAITLLNAGANGRLILHTWFLSNNQYLSAPIPHTDGHATLKCWAFDAGQRQLAVVTATGDASNQHTLQIVQQNTDDNSLRVTASLNDNTWKDALAMVFTSTGRQLMMLCTAAEGEALQLKIYETENLAQSPQIVNTTVVNKAQAQLHLLFDNIVCIAQPGKLYLFGLITQSVLQVLTYDDSHLRPLELADNNAGGQLINRSAIQHRTDAALLHIAGGNIFYFKEGLPCQFSFEHGEQTLDFFVKRSLYHTGPQTAPITLTEAWPAQTGHTMQQAAVATAVDEKSVEERRSEIPATENLPQIGNTPVVDCESEQLNIAREHETVETFEHEEPKITIINKPQAEQQPPKLRPITFPEPEQPPPGWTGDPEFGTVLKYGFYAILIFAIVLIIVFAMM